MNERRSLLNYIFSKEDIPKDAVAVTADNYQNTYGNTIYIPYEIPMMNSAFLIELVRRESGKRVKILEFAGALPGDYEEFAGRYGGNLIITLGYTENTNGNIKSYYPATTPCYMEGNYISLADEDAHSNSQYGMSIPYGPIILGSRSTQLTEFNMHFPTIAKDPDEDLYFKIVLGRSVKLNSADYLQYYSSIYLYEDPNVTIDGLHYESVDLGLPSGLLWATTDIGTEEIGVYGRYFSWSGIYGAKPSTLSTTSSISSTTRYYNYSNKDYSKYNSTDNITTLQAIDDAATIYMGDEWRMPTVEDYQELIDNCTISMETIDGVNCAIFTSNINSNQVVFPLWGAVSYKYPTPSYWYRWTSQLKSSSYEYPYVFKIDNDNVSASVEGAGSIYFSRNCLTVIRGVKYSI